jgi:ubiquitin carboxyl-terminal hydrolase 10
MFMREFKMIDSAPSVDQLKKRLKSQEYEQYGEPFTPEFVYEAIRTLPRFASMRVSHYEAGGANIWLTCLQRGHQQDAQEFLGFLLEGLHDECSQVMGAAPVSTASAAQSSSLPSPTSSTANDAFETEDDWLEVGPRQRSAVTRSSGHSHTLSPITKIFGGQLRSELRVPGNKTSVTLEPYQPLQLDIGSPEIRNIIDALKGLTRPEVLHGDFNSPHGKDVRATKQVFIESVPPVLVLHLKRFQFDAEGYGGTVKIWKKVGYPLEFEFPREVLSRQKRNTILADGSGGPRYRLIGVVYHHGKNASGGHYTVDVRRQDGREWIRIDDTVIRRVRDEDVAEGGAEEDVVKTGAADGRKEPATANRFVGMNDEDAGDDGDWKQAAGGKKWSSVVNGGATTPTSTTTNGQKPAAKQHKESMKENKVAYLLFYQRI